MYNRLDLDLIEIDVFGGKMLYICSQLSYDFSDLEYLVCNRIKHMGKTGGKNR